MNVRRHSRNDRIARLILSGSALTLGAVLLLPALVAGGLAWGLLLTGWRLRPETADRIGANQVSEVVELNEDRRQPFDRL